MSLRLLFSKSLKGNIENSAISHGYRSDHSLVLIEFNDNYEKPCRGYWKFNISLLSDVDYINMVKQCIGNIVNENSDANPQILWETIKCVIRGDTIRYSAKKAQNRNKIKKNLEKEISRLKELYSKTYDQEVLVSLTTKKRLGNTLWLQSKGCYNS